MRFKFLLFLFVVMCTTSKTFSQTNFTGKSVTFLPEEVFVDSLNNYDWSNFQQIPFQKGKADFYTVGEEEQAYWVKFSITNNHDDEDLMLYYKGWQFVDLMELHGNQSLKKTGSLLPVNERAIENATEPVIPILIPNGQKRTYISKMVLDHGHANLASSLALEISSKEYYMQFESNRKQIVMFFMGVFLIMFLYNLFVYVSVKESSYLYYLGIVLFNMIALSQNSLYTEIFFHEYGISPKINQVLDLFLSFLYAIFLIQFTRKFLKTHEHLTKTDTFFKLLIVLVGLTVPMSFVTKVFFANSISSLLGLITFAMITYTGIKSYQKKVHSASYFLLAFSMYIIGMIIFLLMTLGVLERNLLTIFSMPIGSCFEVLFFSIALADRINVLKKENEQKQMEIIDHLKDREAFAEEMAQEMDQQIKRQTKELQKEKEELSIANKNIMDSIFYAERIQKSIMKNEQEVGEVLGDCFIFFRAKDVLSGDFCWAHETEEHIYWAVCDGTGHGVPGALMSIIGNALLNETIIHQGLTEPAMILRELRLSMMKILKQRSGKFSSDGMDISLVVIHKETKKLFFAGAYHSLWILRNNDFIELKGDRFPIGSTGTHMKDFTDHMLELHTDDVLYTFTDGFADQFGGAFEKKYGKKRLQNLLTDIHLYDMEKQFHQIQQAFTEWKQDYVQTDDVLLMGMKI